MSLVSIRIARSAFGRGRPRGADGRLLPADVCRTCRRHPGLRDKLMGVELPPIDKANASRDARIGVEIRNALAFKLYGTPAAPRPPTGW